MTHRIWHPEDDAFTRGSPGADADIVYDRDPDVEADDRALHRTLYQNERLPLFRTARRERPPESVTRGRADEGVLDLDLPPFDLEDL